MPMCVNSHLSRLQDPAEVPKAIHFLKCLCEGTRHPLLIVSLNLCILLLLLAAPRLPEAVHQPAHILERQLPQGGDMLALLYLHTVRVQTGLQ